MLDYETLKFVWWILVGALDWARLILREDGRSNRTSGAADHLGEPWATRLRELTVTDYVGLAARVCDEVLAAAEKELSE